jgi:hypothetical protein
MTPLRAVLVVLVTIGLAAAVGVAVSAGGSSSEEPGKPLEQLLSKASSAPKLPAYAPGSAWPSLPPSSKLGVTAKTDASEGGSTANIGSAGEESDEAPPAEETYVPEEIYVPTEASEATVGGSGGRPHGIDGGDCGC